MAWADVKRNLALISKQVKQELQVYRVVLADERTPWAARMLLGVAVGYLLLPFDLIPDAIPILGQLDDVIIVPGLLWLALKLIPEEILDQARSAVQAASEKSMGGSENNH